MRFFLRERLRGLDLQSKIIVTLVLVIVPTFFVVTLAQYHLARPILENEWRALGVATGERLALKIVTSGWHELANPTVPIEEEIQRLGYQQPSVQRIDVVFRDPVTGNGRLVGSNVEDDPLTETLIPSIVDDTLIEMRSDDDQDPWWDIRIPIWRDARVGKSGKPRGKPIGMVHVVVTTRSVQRVLEAFWKITLVATLITVATLILVLNYFLRKAVANERRLRVAETRNVELSRQLHETERQLLNLEKLAVMGELTANFAHEIGTPLNAISLHLQLLRERLAGPGGEAGSKSPLERIEVVRGEVDRIEGIVKGFLHTTSKPASQRQLTDLNEVVAKTLDIVQPRIDLMNVEVDRRLDRQLGPIRVVPLDVEQVLLNLLNNALDSMAEKARRDPRYHPRLVVETGAVRTAGSERVRLLVHDNGTGIAKENLKNVLKPFFTTKGPGEGTGLGLSICQQIAARYGGGLVIDSRFGAWAKVLLELPFQTG